MMDDPKFTAGPNSPAWLAAMGEADQFVEKHLKYHEFLEAKRITQEAAGFADARSIVLNPKLFDWQCDLVHWALRIGRADHWCDCGLGKTFMQLEWARAVYERTNKNVLILAPLAVAGQTRREGQKFDIEVTRNYPLDIPNYLGHT